MKIMN